MSTQRTTRRDFLKTTSMAAAAALVPGLKIVRADGAGVSAEVAKALETIAILEKADIAPEKVTGYVKAKTSSGKGFAFSWLSGAANLHEVINFSGNAPKMPATSAKQPTAPARKPVDLIKVVDGKMVRIKGEDRTA